MPSLVLPTCRRASVVALAFGTCLVLTGCDAASDVSTSETAEWLRISGNFDETPEEIACIEAAMNDLLSPDELDEWLSQDPHTITVEEIQALPHAIDVADRCR